MCLVTRPPDPPTKLSDVIKLLMSEPEHTEVPYRINVMRSRRWDMCVVVEGGQKRFDQRGVIRRCLI